MSNYISLLDICQQIAGSVQSILDDLVVQTPGEITESIPTTPLIQVYPESGGTDSGSDSDRGGFRGVVRRSTEIIHVDLFARQRSLIGVDLQACFELYEAVEQRILLQQTKPYFGEPAIKSFSWRWERVTFRYGDQTLPYIGVRIYLTCNIY